MTRYLTHFLLYADDTVLLAVNQVKQIYKMHWIVKQIDDWKLDVNTEQNSIIIGHS